jgi:D-alanine-D-alanine ligase
MESALVTAACTRQARGLALARVVVLSGGSSGERAVSLRTAAAIAGALRVQDGRGPAEVRAVEIGTGGGWTIDGREESAAAFLARAPRDTVFFLGLHGGAGENGTIQGLLASSGFAHTGSGVAASALCMNKHWTRLVLQAAGLTTATARLVEAGEWGVARAAVLEELARFGSDGWSVKPNCGGSSVSTFLLAADADPAAAIDAVLATGDAALVEARIRGVETTCGVLGNAAGAARALTPVEIVPHAGRFFDYEEKYSSAGADEHCPPRSLAATACERLRELALRAHRAAACDGYSRTDFIVPRDASGAAREPVVLEINTLPGMTDRSLLPQAAAAEGLDFRSLCLEILALALERADEGRSARA